MPARNKNLMETLMFRRKHLRSTPAIFKTPIKWAPRTPFPALQQAEIGSVENGEPMMAQQLFAASRFLNWAQTNPQEIAEEATVQGIADWNGNESAATGEAANESTSNTTRKVLAIHVATTTAVEEEEEVKARPLLGGRRKFTGAFRWAQVEPTAAALLLMRPPTRSQNQLNLLEGMDGPSSSGGNGRQQPKPKKPVGRPPSRKKRAPPRNLKKEPPANVEPEMQIVPQVQDIVFNEEPASQVKQEVVSRPSTSGYEEPNAAADEEMPELVAEEPMDLEAESTYHPLPIEPSESEDGIVEQLQQQKQQVTQQLAVPSEVENAEPGESPPPNDREGHLDVRRGAHITKNFKVAKRLGAGVFATVFLVRDLNTAKPERQYALKVARNTNEYRAAAKAEIKALEQLKSRAGQQHHFVAQFLRSFDYWGHTCLLFEQYGLSILDFLKTNQYHPFRVNQIREIAYQLIHAVHFLHNSGFVHTDLKPENILFVNSNKCEKEKRWDVPDPKFEVKSRKNKKQTKISVLKDTSIRVIDLGSAREMTPGTVHNDEISTSHYRAPEVILGMGWSYPADVWSLGCILFELYTGYFLFPKLRNLSHLAMMEATIDKFPYTMLGKAEEKKTTGSKYVYRRKLVRDDDIVKTVKENAKRLTKYQKSDNEEDGRLFLLIEEMLVLDPEYRIVLENAKDHSFFYKLDSQYRKKIDLGGGDHETEMKA